MNADGSKKIAMVISARLISHFGSFLSMVAVNALVFQITGSAVWVSFMLALRMIPGVFLAPILGILADRLDRKKTMIFCDIVLATVVGALVLVNQDFQLPWLVFVQVTIGLLGPLSGICFAAETPHIIGESDTLQANSVYFGAMNIITAAVGIFFAMSSAIFSNFIIIFLVDAGTYVVSGTVLLMLRYQRQKSEVQVEQSEAGIVSTKKGFLGALSTLLAPRMRHLIPFLVILLFDAFGSASHNIGFPIFSAQYSSQNPMWLYGWILAAWGLGNASGILLLNRSRLIKKMESETLYPLFTAVMAGGMILIFQSNLFPIVAIAAFIAGIGDGTYQSFYTTSVQKLPDEVRGTVFGVTDWVLKTGFLLGFIAVPLALEKLSIDKTVLLFHGVTLATILVTFILAWSRKKSARIPK